MRTKAKIMRDDGFDSNLDDFKCFVLRFAVVNVSILLRKKFSRNVKFVL